MRKIQVPENPRDQRQELGTANHRLPLPAGPPIRARLVRHFRRKALGTSGGRGSGSGTRRGRKGRVPASRILVEAEVSTAGGARWPGASNAPRGWRLAEELVVAGSRRGEGEWGRPPGCRETWAVERPAACGRPPADPGLAVWGVLPDPRAQELPGGCPGGAAGVRCPLTLQAEDSVSGRPMGPLSRPSPSVPLSSDVFEGLWVRMVGAPRKVRS